jgi:hypothetical protein
MPLLTFTMTRSSFKGRGYAKMLLKAGLNELIRAGQTQCCLVVTRGMSQQLKFTNILVLPRKLVYSIIIAYYYLLLQILYFILPENFGKINISILFY